MYVYGISWLVGSNGDTSLPRTDPFSKFYRFDATTTNPSLSCGDETALSDQSQLHNGGSKTCVWAGANYFFSR